MKPTATFLNPSATPVSFEVQSLATETENSLPANPFVGLRPFETEESLLFFGRQKHVVELLQQLHRTQFLAVIGSSGCGKSSLIRAGLIPKLKAGFLVEERDHWKLAILKPGESPLTNLSEKLLEVVPGSAKTPGALATSLRLLGVDAVVDLLKEPLAGAGANLLLVVDQFEELFRYDRPPTEVQRGDATAAIAPEEKQRQELAHRELRRDEATTFVSLLLAAAEQPDVPIYVVITMRSDFLGDCDAFTGLPEMINKSLYLVPRLDRKRREEAVENPIRLYGKSIAPRLLDIVVNDVGDESDQLPVMQHALMRTWEEWAKDPDNPEVIDLPHYQAAGTISDALSKDANKALVELNTEGRRIAKRMFQALVDTDVQGRNVRRPVHLNELALIAGVRPEHVLEVVDHFRRKGRSFLNLSSDEVRDNPLIDISHESFIRQWSKLREWVSSENYSKDVYTQLVAAAQRHLGAGWGLLRETELQVASKWWDQRQPNKAWAARYSPDFEIAEKFLNDSKAQREKDEEERARKQLEELESLKIRQQNQKLKRMAYALGVLAIVATVSLAATAVSWRRASASERLATEANRDLETKATELTISLGKEKAARDEADRQTQRANEATEEANSQKILAQAEKVKADEARQKAQERAAFAAAETVRANEETKRANDEAKRANEETKKAQFNLEKAQAAEAELRLAKNQVITDLGEAYNKALTLTATPDTIEVAEDAYKDILNIYEKENVKEGRLSILLILGRLFDGSGSVNKPDKAITYYEQALLLFNDGDEVERAKKIETLVKLGDLLYPGVLTAETAVTRYREAIDLGYDPGSEDRRVYLKMADYYGSLPGTSTLDTAIRHYELELAALDRKIAGDPFDKEPFKQKLSTLVKLGTVYSRLENNDKVRETHDKAITLATSSPLNLTMSEALVQIGIGYSRPELRAQREEYFRRAVESAGGSKETTASFYQEIGDGLYANQDYDQALKYFNDALSLLNSEKEASALVLLKIGQTHERLNQNDRAIESYERAGDGLYANQEYDLALNYFNKALSLLNSEKGSALVLFKIGQTYERLNQNDRAIESYQRAIQLDPTSPLHETLNVRVQKLRELQLQRR